jgi:hypothetical protein
LEKEQPSMERVEGAKEPTRVEVATAETLASAAMALRRTRTAVAAKTLEKEEWVMDVLAPVEKKRDGAAIEEKEDDVTVR